MKKILILALTLVAIGLTSCSNDEKEIKKFVDEFAPQLASSGFDLEKDGDAYIVNFDKDRRLIVVKNDDGEWECEQSFGVKQFDPDLLAFAQRTGWVEKKMDDASIAKRLERTEFLDVMKERFVKDIKTKVNATMGGSGSYFTYTNFSTTVHNRTTFDIPGDLYKVVVRFTFGAFPEYNETKTLNGVDVKANGDQTIPITKRDAGPPETMSARVVFEEDRLPDLCVKLYNGTGREYADYVAGELR